MNMFRLALIIVIGALGGCSDADSGPIKEPIHADVTFVTVDAVLDSGALPDLPALDIRTDIFFDSEDAEREKDARDAVGQDVQDADTTNTAAKDVVVSKDTTANDIVTNDAFTCQSDEDCADMTLSSCEYGICQSGTCLVETLPDGSLCSTDGIQCQTCADGVCRQDMLAPLSDGNPCTEDKCVKGSITHTPTADPVQCDDGDACTTDDACFLGSCVGGPPLPCVKEVCASSVSCQDGSCVHVWNPAGASCDDNDACTTGDACTDNHECTGQQLVCDDENPCTNESCTPALGCVFVNNTAACDDNDACTEDGACLNGACQSGNALDCDDNDPCTIDACDAASGCTHTSDPACECTSNEDCDDANACNGIETCDTQTFACMPGTSLSCDDGNLCTDENCDPTSGCVSVNNTAACDDNDACTEGDACANGACQSGTPIACGDGNACNGIETCAAATGCVPGTPLLCDDNDACNGTETCDTTLGCQAGVPPVCDDSDPCTTDSCDTAVGCVYQQDACVAFIPSGPYMDTPTASTNVDAFWIDKIEVRIRDYLACTNAGSCTDPVDNPEPQGCNWNVAGRENHPMNCLNYAQMESYCTWKGGRIPTQDEWKKAARGGCETTGTPPCEAADYRIYPWGDTPPTCNEAVFKDASGIGCGVGTTWAVASKPAGNSPYGLTDAAGNVAEVNTKFCPQAGDVMICGDAYTSISLKIDECFCAGSLVQPHGIRGVGFRCAYDAKPAWAP